MRKIGIFKQYTKKPNEIHYGYLFTTKLFFETKSDEKERTIRVWLPEDYDFKFQKKKYPVIYMSDGQNIVDRYTTAYGEWDIEDRIHERMSQGKEGVIVVGIDCPKVPEQRNGELCPPESEYLKKIYKGFDSLYGDLYGEFLINIVKPLIEETFAVKLGKENTAVGGSSMGGLMAFYLGMKYKNQIGFSLCFSPAFVLFKKNALINEIKKRDWDIDSYGKFYFFMGGKDFERTLLDATNVVYKELFKVGFKEDHLAYLFDSRRIHHESSWSIYFNDAIGFWRED